MKVPYFSQKDLFSCGVAASRMVLDFYGIDKDESTLRKELKTTIKHGTTLSSIQNYFENLGLKCKKEQFGDQQLALSVLRGAVSESAVIAIVNRLIYNQKTPRIQEKVDWESDSFSNHLIVVTAVDENQIHFHDPIPEIGQTSLPIETFLRAWFGWEDGGWMIYEFTK